MAVKPLARAPYERKTIAIPTWDLWLTNLVTAVNAIGAGGGTFDAGNLTGATLAANVLASSLTSTGTLTGGATGAGFTVALSTSTITGTLADARLSNNVPLINGTNAFTGANSFATNPLNLLVGQLAFPAAQNASAGANTLDDYEEGTWTLADGSGAGLAFTVTSATYVKVGQLVYVQGHLAYPVTASGAQAKIAGLPFTPATFGGLTIAFSNSAVGAMTMRVPAATTVDIWTAVGGAVTNVQLSNTTFVFSGAYRATA